MVLLDNLHGLQEFFVADIYAIMRLQKCLATGSFLTFNISL